MTHIAPQGKLHQAQHQGDGGNHRHKAQRGTRMDDTLERHPRDDGKRHGPHVERQVLHAQDGTMQPAKEVLHHIGRRHGNHQHQTHFVEQFAEGLQKRHLHLTVDEREHQRHHQRRQQV